MTCPYAGLITLRRAATEHVHTANRLFGPSNWILMVYRFQIRRLDSSFVRRDWRPAHIGRIWRIRKWRLGRERDVLAGVSGAFKGLCAGKNGNESQLDFTDRLFHEPDEHLLTGKKFIKPDLFSILRQLCLGGNFDGVAFAVGLNDQCFVITINGDDCSVGLRVNRRHYRRRSVGFRRYGSWRIRFSTDRRSKREARNSQ